MAADSVQRRVSSSHGREVVILSLPGSDVVGMAVATSAFAAGAAVAPTSGIVACQPLRHPARPGTCVQLAPEAGVSGSALRARHSHPAASDSSAHQAAQSTASGVRPRHSSTSTLLKQSQMWSSISAASEGGHPLHQHTALGARPASVSSSHGSAAGTTTASSSHSHGSRHHATSSQGSQSSLLQRECTVSAAAGSSEDYTTSDEEEEEEEEQAMGEGVACSSSHSSEVGPNAAWLKQAWQQHITHKRRIQRSMPKLLHASDQHQGHQQQQPQPTQHDGHQQLQGHAPAPDGYICERQCHAGPASLPMRAAGYRVMTAAARPPRHPGPPSPVPQRLALSLNASPYQQQLLHRQQAKGSQPLPSQQGTADTWAVLADAATCVSSPAVGQFEGGAAASSACAQSSVRHSHVLTTHNQFGGAQGFQGGAPCARWRLQQAHAGLVVRGHVGKLGAVQGGPSGSLRATGHRIHVTADQPLLTPCLQQPQQQRGAQAALTPDMLRALAASSEQQGGGQLHTARAAPGASRPCTASSLWSGYDLEEGVLQQLVSPAPRAKPRAQGGRGLSRSSSASSLGQRGHSRDGGTARRGKGARRGSVSAADQPGQAGGVCIQSWHPAVTLDPALLVPLATPVAEVPVDCKGRPYPYVLPPPISGAYPTIAFMSAAAAQAMGLHPLVAGPRMLVRYAGIANSPVKAAFKEAGWRATKHASKWNVCWGHVPSGAELAALSIFQRVGHFPGTWELGRKDYLYRNVAALRRSKGDALDFIPRFFILPRDVEELRTDIDRNPGIMYIQKPVNSSRGRGVRMVVNPAQLVAPDSPALTCGKELLVQRYVAAPYTINGHKFDMRVYVLATCIDPLRVYVYQEGLARFAAQQYSKHHADLSKRCVHLTNYSVNKTGKAKSTPVPAPAALSAAECTAHKWSFTALRQHIEQDRGPAAWQHVWRQVHDIVVGALLAAEPRLGSEVRMKAPHRNTCFEVWGFDVLLDDSLRAWLMEVNTCPSLAADTPLDMRIKAGMVSDALHLLGPVPYDPEVYDAHQQAHRQARLTGLAPASPTPGSGPSSGLTSTRSGATTPMPPAARSSTPSTGSRSAGGAMGGAGGPRPTTPSARPASGSLAAAKARAAAAAAGGAGAGGSAGGTSGGGRMQLPRTVQEAQQMSFKGVPVQQLPEIVVDAEAELARQRGWERVFPCTQEPDRYLELFSTPRALSIMLCKYYSHKAGNERTARRPATTPAAAGGGTGRSRPAGKAAAGQQWRPGGSAW